MIKSTQWLFFDVGSTLIDESKAYEHRINDAIANSSITYDQFYETMISFAKQNKKSDLETIKYFHLKKTDWHCEDETLYPQTVSCLRALNTKYKIGIIANQPLGTEQRLKNMGLSDYVDLVIASAEEGISKPDARIFQIALERAGCLAENAVMIGDRLDNDIAPAKSLGMKTIWIKQGFGGMVTTILEAERPDYSVNNLNGVCKLFEL